MDGSSSHYSDAAGDIQFPSEIGSRDRHYCVACNLCGNSIGAHNCYYEHGRALYRAASTVDALYCVLEGAVKIVKVGPNGEQRIVRVLKAGDIAEIESISANVFEHTAIAVGRVRACRIPITRFRNRVSESGQVQMRLLQQSLVALREAELWLVQLTDGATPLRSRMARLMMRLRVDGGDRIHRLSGEEIAAIIGIRKETVSRIISEFGRQGIVVKVNGDSAAGRYFQGNISALKEFAQEG